MSRALLGCLLALGLYAGGCALDLGALRARSSKTTSHGLDAEADAEQSNAPAGDGGAIKDAAPVEPATTGWFPATTNAAARDAGAATCGAIGLACCMPGNSCSSGACLRGRCTPYGGLFALQTGCGSPAQCVVRNPYSAGCGCANGFVPTSLWQTAQSCDAGPPGKVETSVCTAPGSLPTAFGGMWVASQPANGCSESCMVENPRMSSCSCPPGAGDLRVVTDVESACGGSALSMCIDPSASMLSFGGAYVMTDAMPSRCEVENPLTHDCSCPSGASAQSFTLGDFKLDVCSL